MNEGGRSKSDFRGYLVSRYMAKREQYVDASSTKRRKLCVEFLKAAIQVWLTGAVLHLRVVFESWPHTVRPEAPRDAIDQVQWVVTSFDLFVGEIQTLWQKLEWGEPPLCQDATSTIQDWVRVLDAIVIVLRKDTALAGEEQRLLQELFLPRLIDLRDDMRDVLPILEELTE